MKGKEEESTHHTNFDFCLWRCGENSEFCEEIHFRREKDSYGDEIRSLGKGGRDFGRLSSKLKHSV